MTFDGKGTPGSAPPPIRRTSKSRARAFGLRLRLVGVVFLAIVPCWVLMCFFAYDPPWIRFVIGLLALGAAWFGGELFIVRQLRMLSQAAERLASGDFKSRTGLGNDRGEFGDLARTIDTMAQTIEQRIRDQERTERTLLNRSFQQSVVSALGQFALVSNDPAALLNQAVMLVTQTIEVEYGSVLELESEGHNMRLLAGVGWKEGLVGNLVLSADATTQAGFTLTAGEPIVVEDLPTEGRFKASSWLTEHGVVSGVTVAISGHGRTFGILGAHTASRRHFSEDEVHFLLALATVLAMAVERNQAQAQLQKLAAFVQLNPNPAMELSADGAITYSNDAALKLAFAAGHNHPSGILPTNINSVAHRCLTSRSDLTRLETVVSGRALAWSFHPVTESQRVHCYVEDITERLSLEAQLRHSQKMESVGQLAAGVAHDFNNMLTVIQGHSGLLLAKPDLPSALLDSAQAIYFASERAASLTRQLLMFSRRNVMQPKLLDLGEIVSNLSKMLERLLGETISLQVDSPVEVPMILGDDGMIEQVIMNLAVNARDAMPKGGMLLIQTDVVDLDAGYAQSHTEARTGRFVCLRVTDTGYGMDSITLARIFEPFFTTKEVGKGTGLGLATVYGIVKQHEGWIEVASSVGQGATFTTFFPCCHDSREPKVEPVAPAPELRGGNETILMVEDEPVLRELARVILEDCGYKILEAASGREAIEVWNRQSGTIDLLLTDMVMPEGVSGMDLAHKLHAHNPGLKIVFASGYSMDDLDDSFLRQGHAVFLQKPYTHLTLAKAVRDALDTPQT